MDLKFKERLQSALDAMKNLLKDGSLPEATYHKMLVSLAYEYMAQGEIHEGIALLNQCNPEYFTKTITEHMEDDPEFEGICRIMAVKLTQYGIIESDVNLEPTQKPAEA